MFLLNQLINVESDDLQIIENAIIESVINSTSETEKYVLNNVRMSWLWLAIHSR